MSSDSPDTPDIDPVSLLYRFPQGLRPDAAGMALSWAPGQGPFEQQERLEPNASISSVQWQPTGLSADECAAVVAMGRARPTLEGRVELGANAYRVSHISWIEPEPDTHWLFHKVGLLFAQANRRYGFELTGLADALQFTEYGPGQHFDWHMDIGREQTSLRKLSMTLQLSTPNDYEGGALEFVGLSAMPESRLQGSATFFPSFMGHRITQVTRGIRCSLVAWGSGPPFR